MTITIGDKIPAAVLTTMTEQGPGPVATEAFFAGKTVALFSVPGAFTPTCSAKHLPGFIEKADDLFAKGVDVIACMSVNDVFVMKAWGDSQGAGDKVAMLADGNGDFARALGLEIDLGQFGMGKRAARFSLLAKDGEVAQLYVEEGGDFKVSSADHMLANL